MGKIRDYTYGSPKFEKKLNKAISDASDVKLYLHQVLMVLMSADNFEFDYGIDVYSLDDTPFFTLDNTPTVADVTSFITPYISTFTHKSPAFIDNAAEFHLTIESDVLKGIAISLADSQQVKKAITTVTGAADSVTEV